MKYDVIVCGAGVQGFWTANHLAQKNQNVLLLEQFPFPHTRGSSQGPSRITRYSYTTLHHARMMLDGFKLWKNLEDYFGSQLFVNCGLLCVLNDDLLASMTKTLDAIKQDYQLLNSDDVERRFPGVSSLGRPAVYERTGGVLKSQKCLEALHRRFLEQGGTFLDTTEVLSVKPISNQHVDVITSRGIFSATTLVLTCGPWTNKMLRPLNLRLPLKVKRICVEYWQAKRPELYDSKNFPATIFRLGTFCYSTPILEYPGLMKVCAHGGVDVDPDETDRYNRELAQNHRRDTRSVVVNNYPNLIPHAAVTEKCLYTNTPDEDFILDYHPKYKNIVIGAGFSGHGFKLSPVVGDILSDLAMKRTPKHEMKNFLISRFNKSSL